MKQVNNQKKRKTKTKAEIRKKEKSFLKKLVYSNTSYSELKLYESTYTGKKGVYELVAPDHLFKSDLFLAVIIEMSETARIQKGISLSTCSQSNMQKDWKEIKK